MRSPRIPLQVILAISDFQNPHFQNKRNCKTVLVKMSFICIRLKKTWIAYQLASLWNKGLAGATWKWLAWHFTQVGIIAGEGGGGGILLGIFGWVVPPGSTNPDPISDQNMSFSKPVFRPHAVTYKFHARFQTKKSQKPYPLFGAAHNYIAYIRECPPGIIATFKKRDSDREVPVPS